MKMRFVSLVILAIILAGLTVGCQQQALVSPPTTAPQPQAQPTATAAMVPEEVNLTMSFVPSGDTQEIIASGDELANMIEERTGYNVEANVATSYAAVVEAMCAENADIGWLNTFGYILARERCGVDVILATVRFGEPFYTGQIIARADSGINTLEDLAGKTFCWVDPLSTSGYIIPRVMIQAVGINPDTGFADTVMAGSHNNVVTAVYNGDCDAGATFVDARASVEDELPDVMDKVKVIAESPQIPNDTVSVRPGLPDEVVQNVKNALLDISDSEEGQAALQQLYEIEDLQPVDDTFYDAFRTTLNAAGVNIEDFVQQ